MNQQSPGRFSFVFTIFVGIFIASLITANIIAVKFLNLGGLLVPAGIIIFPISYIVGDVITEVYGFRVARRIILLGFFCNLLVVIAIIAAQILPGAVFWDGQAAYERILGYTPRLVIASFVAYLIGEFANSLVLSKMKVATKGRWLWTRTIGSTIVGQGLDSAVFIAIAFIGNTPSDVIMTAILTQWIFKSVYEIVATPITYLVIGYVKKREGIDVYDTDLGINPFAK